MTTPNANRYVAWRATFPSELDRIAVETAGADGASLAYSWRDLDEGSAMIANLLQSSTPAVGARILVQTAPSVEALMLYLAVLRAGFVHLPMAIEANAAELERVIADAQPAVLVCTRAEFGVASKMAFQAGTGRVFTLDHDRSGSLLERAVHHRRDQSPVVLPADATAVMLPSAEASNDVDRALPPRFAPITHAELARAEARLDARVPRLPA